MYKYVEYVSMASSMDYEYYRAFPEQKLGIIYGEPHDFYKWDPMETEENEQDLMEIEEYTIIRRIAVIFDGLNLIRGLLNCLYGVNDGIFESESQIAVVVNCIFHKLDLMMEKGKKYHCRFVFKKFGTGQNFKLWNYFKEIMEINILSRNLQTEARIVVVIGNNPERDDQYCMYLYQRLCKDFGRSNVFIVSNDGFKSFSGHCKENNSKNGGVDILESKDYVFRDDMIQNKKQISENTMVIEQQFRVPDAPIEVNRIYISKGRCSDECNCGISLAYKKTIVGV